MLAFPRHYLPKPHSIRITFFVITFGLLLYGCQGEVGNSPRFQHHEARPLMGTLVEIAVAGETKSILASATAAAFKEMTRLSDMMNHYNAASVVSEINRNAGLTAVSVPPELYEVLVMASKVSERTQGAFDITVGSMRGWRFDPDNPAMPTARELQENLALINYHNVILDTDKHTVMLRKQGMQIDLGGIAKLYILHAGMRVLQGQSIHHAMVNGGGDVEVIGSYDGHPWRIGIRNPQHPEEYFMTLELTEGFVVTSGDYERAFLHEGKRYHHILDPRTGMPAEGPRQVTVIGKDLAAINGLSAAIMVMGSTAGSKLLKNTPGLAGVIVDAEDDVHFYRFLDSPVPTFRLLH
jgi:FAD:protein FMN transferase